MTQTEKQIEDLKQTLATYVERLDYSRKEIETLSKELDNAEAVIDKQRDLIASQQSQIEVLKAGFEDFKKRWDESERRRWTIFGVVIAAGLAFVANLVLLLLRR